MDRPADPAPDIYAMPAHLIRRCHQIAVSLFHEECPGAITPIQFAALSMLCTHRAIDQITLAGLIALNRTSAGEVVERLEAAGLVMRTADPADRRINLVSLTAAGRRRVVQLRERVERVQQRLLAPLDQKERSAFMRLLSKVATENNEASRAPLRRLRA